MCGLLTWFSINDLPDNYAGLELIKHRGPDGKGQKKFRIGDKGLFLGHTRLAIIDLSESAFQPMPYIDRYWIIYNGEIFNYLELKAELESCGYQFKTRSDTEVLLASYNKWGHKCLNFLNGMFAFVIYDTTKETLFCARDRFGIKPLYYMNTEKGLAIASEMKQFSGLPGFTGNANMPLALSYIMHGDFAFSSDTLFDQVQEVMPGCYFTVDLKEQSSTTIQQIQWYELPLPEKKETFTYDEALARFQYLFEDAIRIRMRSDVDLGVMLSGGLDSSSVSCMVNQFFTPLSKLKTYSAYFGDKEFDELGYVKQVVDHCDFESHRILINPELFFDSLDKAIWFNDLPLSAGSILGHFQLYQTLPESAPKVIFEGQGGDEILCGYDAFFWSLIGEYLKDGEMLKSGIEYVKYRLCNRGNPLRDIKRIRCATHHADFVFSTCKGFGKNVSLEKYQVSGIPRYKNSIRQMHDQRMIILRSILHSVDRVSMSAGRETRVPFLDYRLVEFCLNLPKEFKISHGFSKRILRSAMKDVVPGPVRLRKNKMGFRSPEKKWAIQHLSVLYKQCLQELKNNPMFDHQVLRREFDEVLDGKRPFSNKYWRAINFDRWQKLFKVSI